MPEPTLLLRALLIVVWAVALLGAFIARRLRRSGWLGLAWVLILGVGLGGAVIWRPRPPASVMIPAYAAARPLPAYHIIASGEITLTEVAATPTPEADAPTLTPAPTITATLEATPALTATVTPPTAESAPMAEDPTGWLLLFPVETGAVISASQVISVASGLIPRFVVEIAADPAGVSDQSLQPGDTVDVYAVAREVAEKTVFTLDKPDLTAGFPITQALVLRATADAVTGRVTLGLTDQAAVQRLVEAQPWVTFYLVWRR